MIIILITVITLLIIIIIIIIKTSVTIMIIGKDDGKSKVEVRQTGIDSDNSYVIRASDATTCLRVNPSLL